MAAQSLAFTVGSHLTQNDKSVLITSKDYRSRFPLTWAYLEECRKRLSSRNKGKMGDDWHGYVYKKNHTRFNNPKLLVPSIATGSCFAADIEGNYYFVGSGGGGGGGYGISLLPDTEIQYYYLLGLLNSSLLSAYLKSISTPFQHGYIALNRQYIEQLPIRTINFSDAEDKARHEKMVSLVERMLELTPLLSPQMGGRSGSPRTPQDKERVKREIESTDRQIDRLVYELYGLTEDEVKVVEGY